MALLAVVLIALVGLPVPLGEGAAVAVGGSAAAALYAVKRGGRGHVRLHDGAAQGFVSRNN
ncbi:hypothetical protein PJ900_09425 [Tistrella mobilis]|uniref:Uncharacterized protein n=1 Tax=Tistrella mobilis TaxID=171437 RepID=A0A162KTQ1_9PROT|nr:hypothetical protein [Tistrella mobilis]KYO52069.1 hypothetical protein AUP44_06195 [Tistrella mobilis]